MQVQLQTTSQEVDRGFKGATSSKLVNLINIGSSMTSICVAMTNLLASPSCLHFTRDYFPSSVEHTMNIKQCSHLNDCLCQGHGSVYFSWFHDLFTMGALLTTVQRPHRSKTTLISNGVFCLLESKILSIGQTLLYSLGLCMVMKRAISKQSLLI
jgi:hypothetical protein